MTALIRAELLKLRSTRANYGLALAALLFVPVSVALAVLTAGESGSAGLDTGEGVRHVMAAAWSGASMVLVFGILCMAGEFRHGPATATFLVSPDRRRVVSAKLAAASVVGLALAAASAVLTLAVGLPWLSAEGAQVDVFGPDVGPVLLGAAVATVLYALIGVGVGVLLPNQTVALTVALTWVLLVEGLLVGLAPAVGRWLPGGAASALTSTATPNGGLLPAWAAALVLTGYGLAFAAAGSRLIARRDVT
jgi:ABC-2 type transport system permease protein